MPTLPDYTGVAQIQNKSPGLPYSSPHLTEKVNLDIFLYTYKGQEIM